jgi:hypothetical protein
MKSKAKQQGHLDGLCGVYAIVNALSELGIEDCEGVFSTACQSLVPSRWPETLWEGTTLRDLETMIKYCVKELAIEGVNIRYPFRSHQPPSNAEFWDEFDKLFIDNRKRKCAIIGLEEPSLHWLVAKPHRQSLVFVDSDSLVSENKIKRENIYAGARRTNGEEYRLNRKEVILFEKEK